MRAPSNLHILATAAGLSDEDVVGLWSQAQQKTIAEIGSASHPQYRNLSRQYMLRLIEERATADVPPTAAPWVLFDIHLGVAIVKVRNGLKSAHTQIRDYLADLRGKHAA